MRFSENDHAPFYPLYRGVCFLETAMAKYQKPIRHVSEEVFDADLSLEKSEELEKAYKDFWATLDPDLALTLDLMLL